MTPAITRNRAARLTAAAVLACLSVLSFTGLARAHKVNVFAYAEGGRVYAECYYNDGKRCVGSAVVVEDASGKKLAEGRTDEKGVYSFEAGKAEDLKVVLHAGTGHQAEYLIKAGELRAAGVKGGTPEASGEARVGRPGAEKGQLAKDAPPPTAAFGPEDVRPVVEEAVEAKLRPLYGMLTEIKAAQDRPRLSEIVGGIGYIVGLMGIVMYLKARKG